MKLFKRMFVSVAAAIALLGGCSAFAQDNPAKFGGEVRASNFAYGVAANTPALRVDQASVSNTGVATLSVAYGSITLTDGTTITPLSILAPVIVGSGGNQETVTPTAVSCATPAVYQSCTFTATFANQHGTGDPVVSGTVGLQEALNYAFGKGGASVVVDYGWKALGGTNTLLTAATPFSSVSIKDTRFGPVQTWVPQPAATTILPLPTTLTTTTALASATPAGSFGTGTYFQCVAYVDIMGQEGPCSATFSQAGLATGSFIFTAPAASTGAVGYTIYISLTSGTYALAYKVPLTASVCVLTTLETTTPACAVTNAIYGQTGATATVSAITVNTSPILLNKTVISTTAITHGTPNGRTTYAYSPGSATALTGVEGATFPFTISAAAATAVPSALGTINIPPGYMNFVGRKIRVCGYGTMSGASAATVVEMSLQWDSFGQNTAGLPVTVADNQATATTAFSGSVVNATFCTTLVTTVSGAGATAGTLLQVGGYACWGVTSAGVQPTCSPTSTTAAVSSLNLASEARLHVVYTHVTGTDGAGFILNGVTIESL